jgi:hypothetical protein
MELSQVYLLLLLMLAHLAEAEDQEVHKHLEQEAQVVQVEEHIGPVMEQLD